MAKSPKIYANIKSIKEAYGDVWGTPNLILAQRDYVTL
jgi:hypothetical protein